MTIFKSSKKIMKSLVFLKANKFQIVEKQCSTVVQDLAPVITILVMLYMGVQVLT